MNSNKLLHVVAFVLLVVGGVNWGLIGLGQLLGGNDWNVVHLLFGNWPVVEWVVYVLVGLSAGLVAATHTTDCKICSKK